MRDRNREPHLTDNDRARVSTQQCISWSPGHGWIIVVFFIRLCLFLVYFNTRCHTSLSLEEALARTAANLNLRHDHWICLVWHTMHISSLDFDNVLPLL